MKWLFDFKQAKHAEPRENNAEKPPKNTLLQSYFISLLGLVLCVTMFLSTTYAWFSGGVTNTANEIHIGVLDVGLYKQDGSHYLDMALGDTKLFDSGIFWEPGYTALETIQIHNRGDLAFKYTLGFTDGVLAEDSLLLPDEVSCYFDVWVYPHADGEGPAATSYQDILAADSGWVHAGSLDAILNGTNVLSGAMEKKGDVATFTIALHMREDAAALVMGQKMHLSVRLIAYQRDAEVDGFQNSAYDETTVVSSVSALLAAIENAADGDVIVLAPGTYDFTETALVINKPITLQGADSLNQPVLQFVTADSTEIAHGIEVVCDDVIIKDIVLVVDPATLGETND